MNHASIDFNKLATATRGFAAVPRRLVGPVPTIAITPVADGRSGAYEDNQASTWKLVERVHQLLDQHLRLPDGTKPRIVVPPELVYGARTGALAQEYYAKMGVSANIWVSRSWAYSDELMSACMGIGSSEWQQAAYGLNQTNRPGAVWLKAFCAAMDEKKRPIFSIYNPDLEPEEGDLPPYVAERLLRFARCAVAVAEMRGKNYASVGSVSMGIIGSDVRRNLFHHYFGMGAVSIDMVAVKGRLEKGFYDHEEFERAFQFMKERCKFQFGSGQRPYGNDELLAECVRMTLIVRDLMVGNPRLADESVARQQGFQPDVELAQGCNAIAGGTQGQRQWTDLYPNFDMPEAMLNSSFDWDGYRQPFIVATENDSKNGVGMLAAHLLSGLPQLFADIRTNWTPRSVLEATGFDVSDLVPSGFIDKRNSGAGALDYAVDLFQLTGCPKNTHPSVVAEILRQTPDLQQDLMSRCFAGTVFEAAVLEYFRGDGLSSSFRSPGEIPMTAYRYNVVDSQPSCSVVEGNTVELPDEVAAHISRVTDQTWPETYWVPRGMSSFEYMSKIGPNHDANSFGLIGADLITLNSMLRIPIDFHNIPEDQIFRPTIWQRYADNDFLVCEKLGPLYI